MPQMAPMMWLILFFLFSFIFIMFNMLNYYNFLKFNKNIISKKDLKNFEFLYWKW
uniref:ATP synthase F0 subunit 8 n=1 Tax=Tanytarsus formosanus TaxID=1636531 RepID=UPI0022DCD9AC|nr:ATP synthase F0 subunit 8 [Tanytarsus formosanus]WAB46369.1 ATP synthase F0 subunit 8 [Tanytarsus formosanus]